jgi:Ser/Thr protein kinase RdoA (MazF antagonist)
MTVEALAFQHGLMQRVRQAGLSFVPLVYPTNQGKTWSEHEGNLWEVTSWQPGKADFEANPSAERLRNACAALARLHEAWTPSSSLEGKCPAVQRRLARAAEWSQLIASGWQEPRATQRTDSLRPLVERAWRLLATEVPRVPRLLEAFADKCVPLQPCLCDVWHDHLLFEGDALTGLVDFGGVKIDHVSVDLARMLGSLVGDDGHQWRVGLEAYRQVRSLSAEEEAMARALDATGTIVGLVNWLIWIYRDNKQFDDWSGVAGRMTVLIERIERPSRARSGTE